MNTKTTKFLAVLAVLAMAFAVVAVVTPAESDDAAAVPVASGIYKYDETAGYTAVDFESEVTVSSDTTWYVYSTDSTTAVPIGNSVTISAGVTLTLTSYGDTQYTASLANTMTIDVSATSAGITLDGANLTVIGGGVVGTKGIVGLATASLASGEFTGLVTVNSGSTLTLGNTSNVMCCTAVVKAMAGSTVIDYNGSDAANQVPLVAPYSATPANNPKIMQYSASTEGYVSLGYKAQVITYTIAMDAVVDDNNNTSTYPLMGANHKAIVAEGCTLYVSKLNISDYGATITNNGSIVIGSSGILKFISGSTATDVSATGILGNGTVTVKSGGILVFNEGKANENGGSSVSGMFAIGHNTIVVEYGGKLYAADNSSTTEYWGIVGDAVGTDSSAIHNTDYASITAYIWALKASGAKMTIQAKYVDPETGSSDSTTNGAIYQADGTVSIGTTVTADGYDWASRFDEIIINSGTATLASGLKLSAGNSGPTLTVAKGATLTSDVTDKSFVTIAGSVVNVKGTMDMSNMTLGSVAGSVVVYTGGILTVKSIKTDAKDPNLADVVYQGGKINHKNDTTVTDMTSYYSGSTQITVNNETALNEAIEQGADNIKLDTTAGAITLTDSVTVPTGVALVIDGDNGLTVADKKELILEGGSVSGIIKTASGTITIPANKPLKGNVTFTAGSIAVSGSFTQTDGVITVADNSELKVSGTLNGKLTIKGDADPTGVKVEFIDTFTVSPTGELILSNNAGITYIVGVGDATSITAAGTFYLYGVIQPLEATGNATINVNETGTGSSKKTSTFTAFAGAQLSGRTLVEGSGSINLEQAQNVQKIDQDISADKTYGQLESVEVIGTLSIKNNSTVTILGSLTIDENVSLTIEKGSTLIVNDGIATVTVDGKLIVDNGAYLTIEAADSVAIAGTLQSSGIVTIGTPASTPTVKVTKGGLIDIKDDTNSSITVVGGLTVNSGANVTIRAEMSITGITNKGTVTLNNAVLAANSTITMAGNGAVLDVVSIEGKTAGLTLSISDEGLVFATGKVVGSGDYATYTNTVSYAYGAAEDIFKGLKVTEAVASYDLDGTTHYNNSMDLSGSMAYTDGDSKAKAVTVTANGQDIEVNDSLTIGAAVTLSNAQKLYVVGEILAIATESGAGNAIIAGTTGSMISVSGEITARQKIANDDSVVSAAYYSVDVSGITYHVYTTLAAAIADEVKDIKTYGDVPISANLEIPTETTITNSGTIAVGSSDDNSVVVLVKDGAVIKGSGTIDVYGSITFENKKNCKNVVSSDVTVENGDAVTYTSVYLAIAGSSAGDVITITRDGTTKLATSLTIPEGRTLNVPASKVLMLAPGVTLTVNGTLQTSELITVDKSTYADAEFATVATLIDAHTAAIKVNGVFKSMADLTYEYYKSVGAYYSFADSTGNFNYVSPVEIAVGTEAKTITIYGEVVATSAEWAGTSTSAKTFNIDADAELTATLLYFSYVNFNGTGTFTGTLAYEQGSVSATEVTGLVTKNKDGSNAAFYLDSVTIDATNEDAEFTILSGEVYAKTITGDVTIADDAILYVAESSATGLAITGDLYVLGGLAVDNARIANVTGTTVVLGAIIVAPASEDGTKAPGTLTMDDVFLGILEDDVLGTDASITGPITFDILYAAADATVPTEVLTDTSMKYTIFYVEDAVYLTAFTKATTYYVADVVYEIETADFEGWYNEDGESALLKLAKIGATGWTEVYADIEYNVYTLVVKTDDGVKSVAVDGKELISGVAGENVFVSYVGENLGFMLSEGKYTVSFTLKDGYEGTPILYDADGKAVIGGYGITMTGDADHRVITYQLSGTQKEVTPEPEPTPVEKESEWNVTTILLLVLVILIAIMAVIVALRLNRS